MIGHDETEYDPRVKEMLERQVPLRLNSEADWAGALHRAESERESDGGRMHAPHGRLGEWLSVRMRSRRVLAPALGIAVLVIAGAATAGGVRWWSGPSTPSAIDTKEATSLVEYTLSSDYSIWKKGQTIAIWRVPQPDGSVCVFRALASPKPSAPGTSGLNPGGGGFCGSSESNLPPGQSIGSSFSTTSGPGGYSWLISGNVSSESGIARLELRSANGSLPLAYDNGWFLVQLPWTSSSNEELPQGGPYVLVGYDSRGTAIARLGLQRAFKGFSGR